MEEGARPEKTGLKPDPSPRRGGAARVVIAAAARGQSVNAWINQVIDRRSRASEEIEERAELGPRNAASRNSKRVSTDGSTCEETPRRGRELRQPHRGRAGARRRRPSSSSSTNGVPMTLLSFLLALACRGTWPRRGPTSAEVERSHRSLPPLEVRSPSGVVQSCLRSPAGRHRAGPPSANRSPSDGFREPAL